jgi:polygalacturonase
MQRRSFLTSVPLSAVFLSACGRPNLCHSKADAWQQLDWTQADRIVDSIQLPRIPERDFSISDYGARPADSLTVAESFDVLPAIRAALAACIRAGGGRVVIPAGFWFARGPIHLASKVELHLAQDAYLRFSGEPAHYLPAVLTRWEGSECFNYSPLIYAHGASDIALTGAGTIDGQGERYWLPWRAEQKPDQQALRQMGHDGIDVSQRRFGAGHKLRPQFVQFISCERVRVEGLQILDSPFWVVHPVYCRDVTVRGLNVVSRHINSDGVDPDSSENVLIEYCRFEVGDDGVAIKAGRDQDGWRVDKPSRFIVVRDCEYIGDTGGGVAIGSEMSGGVSDVFIERYRLPKANHALYFKANLDRGGQIERVYIRDIEIGQADSVLIFTNSYHGYRGGNAPTRFQEIYVENVRCQSARVGLALEGHAKAPLRALHVRALQIQSAQIPASAIHVQSASLHHVEINGVLLKTLAGLAAPSKAPKS